MVGVLNTLVTFGVIYFCKSFLDMNLYISNALGYIAGLINSFLCNKTWVFKSEGSYSKEAVIFICGFLICYGIQLLTVWIFTDYIFDDRIYQLTKHIAISGYGIATIIGNVVYTVVNFIYNKLITFRKR